MAILVPLAIPSVGERMLQGFGQTDASGGAVTDEHTVTAGRNVIWPFVIDKIGESPALGHGKLAMRRTGLADYVQSQVGDNFGHPHNAYLQWMLDNGVPSLLGLLVFYAIILFFAARLFRDKRSPLFAAVGGVSLSLVLALLVASMGSQTFYPREGAVGMWAAIGLLLRASIERKRGIARETLAARQARNRSSPPRGGSVPPRRSTASVLSHVGQPRFP